MMQCLATIGDSVSPPVLLLMTLAAGLVLGYRQAPLWLWTLIGAALVYLGGVPVWLCVTLGALSLLLLVGPLRRPMLSAPILRLLQRLDLMPTISATERTAIEAGTVWIDGELFSGRPDLRRLANESYPDLTEEERLFLEGPVEEICSMTDDWRVHRDRDLPREVWRFLARERFFGLIIPVEYGGRGFSAAAHSAAVVKLSSRSTALGVTVMVPNSLGPAELLVHYGTQSQKDHYLPRLADGREMPCFALTEPQAGSDAGAMQARGEVFRGADGTLQIRLSWNKRYITLAAIATVIGVAFVLHDPEQLLGKGSDLGITCALIPADTPGVVLGRRHDPLGVPFYNCPTRGENVVVSVDAIIGGVEGAGLGWRMLMESLAAGRGISLPAMSTAGAILVARVAGAYARVRRQFGLSIGKFEGVQEPLARIGGSAYLLEAARRYTCGALDGGSRPAVVTAIVKYHSTEMCRRTVNDGMDVLGGAGISRGPRNVLANLYGGLPISITVEGANILTRTLMIFGQGAIRCHPFAFREIDALARDDLRAFDSALWSHLGHVVGNASRTLLLNLSRGVVARAPTTGPTAKYWRKIAWGSATFAMLADAAMGLLGGQLKRKETLTGRFADVFSWLYLATAALRRFEAEGRRADDLPLLQWCAETACLRIQDGLEDILREFPVRGIGWLFRGPMWFWTRLNPLGRGPSDRVVQAVAELLQTPGEQRDRLSSGIYLPKATDQAIGRYEHALVLCAQADRITHRIKDAMRQGRMPAPASADRTRVALELGVIESAEAELLAQADRVREDAIQVDSFTLAEYLAQHGLEADREVASK